ncbi:MAG: polysaccharide biosynthesis/export family protein [Gammaproteobacteria bacterium]|nr:polysaccharide biosynthesis/export family protein [Gammaproteobacteria bacterium]
MARTNLLLILCFMVFNVAAEQKTDMQVAPVDIVDDAYQIGPGDVLDISVWKEEGMQLQILVRPDGGITYPLAGEIKAGGLTTKALSEELVEKLKRYIPHPNVTVSVMQSVSNKVYVIGKVNRPGEFTATGYMDVLQALTMAGGLTPFADSDEIKIIRRTETGSKVRLFDYDEVVSGERLDMNIILKAGDTVVVP